MHSRITLVIICCVILFAGCGSGAVGVPAMSPSLVNNYQKRFVVMADSQGNKAHQPVCPYVFDYMVMQIAELEPQPAFVLMVGDLVNGGGRDSLEVWWDAVRPLTDKGIKIFTVVGNHDVGNNEADAFDEQIAYQEFFTLPENGPPGYEELVYSFDHGDFHFAILDSYYHDGVEWKDCEIDSVQREWLADNLVNSDKKYKFVFAHSPAYPVSNMVGECLDRDSEARDRFWEVMDDNNVAIYFSGHEHLYSRWNIDADINADWKNEVVQIITGGAGGALVDEVDDDAKPDVFISAYHFVIVDAGGDHLNVNVHDIDRDKVDFFEVYR